MQQATREYFYSFIKFTLLIPLKLITLRFILNYCRIISIDLSLELSYGITLFKSPYVRDADQKIEEDENDQILAKGDKVI